MSAVPARPSRPGAVLERGRQLGGRHAHVLLEPEHEARIDRSRAGRHDEPVERREAHRRVDRPAAADGRQRGARAEVTADDAQPIDRAADHGRGAPRGVGVREAVEAVLAQGPALAPFGRDGVGRGGRRACRRGRPCRSRPPPAGPGGRPSRPPGAASDLGWWSGARSVSAARFASDLVVQADGLPVARPTVDDAVTDRGELARSRRWPRRRPRRRRRPGARAGRPCRRRASPASRTRSFRLLEPALTTRMRPGSPGRRRCRAGRAGSSAQAGHVQPWISGASSPSRRV